MLPIVCIQFLRGVDGVSGTSVTSGRSIRLFLADGTADGIVVAGMGNWVGNVLSAPRRRVAELLRRPECTRTGIYVMHGPDPDCAGGVMAYIGEADDVAARMRVHIGAGDHDFFDRLSIVVSSDDNLTKSHARYLESQLIRATKDAGSVRLANTRAPDFRRLPEADLADMDYFLAQLRIVLPILGYGLLEPTATATTVGASGPAGSANSVFMFDPLGASARAIETESGFAVLSGSTARHGATETFPAGYRTLRDNLIAEGALSFDGERLRFTRDVVFASPSAAASIVAGRSASGPGEWRTTDGTSYRDTRATLLSPR